MSNEANTVTVEPSGEALKMVRPRLAHVLAGAMRWQRRRMQGMWGASAHRVHRLRNG